MSSVKSLHLSLFNEIAKVRTPEPPYPIFNSENDKCCKKVTRLSTEHPSNCNEIKITHLFVHRWEACQLSS